MVACSTAYVDRSLSACLHLKRGCTPASPNASQCHLTAHTARPSPLSPGILYGLNEQYLHSDDNALFAISISVVAGFVVMLPLIVHPAAAIIVTALLIAVEVELYGLLPYFGMKLNSVTIVNLISAIGIAVEFHTHLARAFMLAKGDRVTRVVAALREVGSPIVCGGQWIKLPLD